MEDKDKVAFQKKKTGWRMSAPLTKAEQKRLHEGIQKLENSLANADEEARKGPRGLPKDWRSRVLRRRNDGHANTGTD